MSIIIEFRRNHLKDSFSTFTQIYTGYLYSRVFKVIFSKSETIVVRCREPSGPLILIISFLIILISGQHVGGLYVMYLVMALPHGGVHSILGVVGIAFLLFSLVSFGSSNKFKVRFILRLTGLICLWLSLFYLFCRDTTGYNLGTFKQVLPIMSISLFGLISICFLLIL